MRNVLFVRELGAWGQALAGVGSRGLCLGASTLGLGERPLDELLGRTDRLGSCLLDKSARGGGSRLRGALSDLGGRLVSLGLGEGGGLSASGEALRARSVDFGCSVAEHGTVTGSLFG